MLHYAALLSDFVSGSICSVQIDAAAIKCRVKKNKKHENCSARLRSAQATIAWLYWGCDGPGGLGGGVSVWNSKMLYRTWISCI